VALHITDVAWHAWYLPALPMTASALPADSTRLWNGAVTSLQMNGPTEHSQANNSFLSEGASVYTPLVALEATS